MTDFIRVPSNPTPPNGELFFIDTADGAKLRAALFPAENARGSVVLMGGRSEFIEKYFEVVEDLRARGLNVATMDWRGQGLSSRMLPVSEKGHITDFGTYASDLRNFVEDIVKPRFGDAPRILMTHSMGGMPGLMLLAEGYDAFDSAVLCAPMTKLALTPVRRIAARIASRAACKLGGSRMAVLGVREYSLAFEGNALTSDRRRHERFRALQAAGPGACISAPTFGWLRAAVNAIDDIHAPGRLGGIKPPVLIISAERDELVDSDDHLALAAAYDGIETVTVKDALHEILMERDVFRDEYWRHFDRFVAPLFEEKSRSGAIA